MRASRAALRSIGELRRVLGVGADASLTEIKAAFRAKAMLLHPDHARLRGVSTRHATRRFQELQAAYREILAAGASLQQRRAASEETPGGAGPRPGPGPGPGPAPAPGPGPSPYPDDLAGVLARRVRPLAMRQELLQRGVESAVLARQVDKLRAATGAKRVVLQSKRSATYDATAVDRLLRLLSRTEARLPGLALVLRADGQSHEGEVPAADALLRSAAQDLGGAFDGIAGTVTLELTDVPVVWRKTLEGITPSHVALSRRVAERRRELLGAVAESAAFRAARFVAGHSCPSHRFDAFLAALRAFAGGPATPAGRAEGRVLSARVTVRVENDAIRGRARVKEDGSLCVGADTPPAEVAEALRRLAQEARGIRAAHRERRGRVHGAARRLREELGVRDVLKAPGVSWEDMERFLQRLLGELRGGGALCRSREERELEGLSIVCGRMYGSTATGNVVLPFDFAASGA